MFSVRNWRVASKAQRREFSSLFEDYLVHYYGQRFAQYGGETLRVNGSKSDPAGVIVTSQIIRPQGPPIEVDWRLVVSDGRYRISDVSIDGVSMALTQRSEFAVIVHAMADNWRVSSRQCARRFKAATASFRSHCDRQQAPESRA